MLHILSYNVHSNKTLKFNELWKKWKSLYAKQYNDPNEELIRQRIWNKNLIKIQLHNLRYDLGFETYSIGLSRFTDVEWNEFCSMYNVDKRLIIPESSFIEEDYDVNNVGWTPDSYDWRHLNVVNEPRDEMVVGGSQQETLDPIFVLFGTSQQGVPVILRELVPPDVFSPVSPTSQLEMLSLGYPSRD
ncbi:unnamed protein product [Schistosoma mattheei]|uniref:Uncharacterized protein n=1 Tax=Schistosoma mattheei TaxID=31246 RepID=A0A183NKE2_9TREM|nr:unnamed protein product [Schistosoma mattheei]